MQMNDHVRDWVAALRSGDYTQAHQYMKLVRNDKVVGHCCLGVASELAGCTFAVPEGYDQGQLGVVDLSLVENDDDDLEALAQLDDMPGWLLTMLTLTTEDQITLVGMNDGGSTPWNTNPAFTFEMIADTIEKAATDGTSLAEARDALHGALYT